MTAAEVAASGRLEPCASAMQVQDGPEMSEKIRGEWGEEKAGRTAPEDSMAYGHPCLVSQKAQVSDDECMSVFVHVFDMRVLLRV